MKSIQKIDLHTHSYCSDGTFSPEGLVLLAKKQGLAAIALTDHDTIRGLPAFMEAGEKYEIETIPGVEMACLWEGFHRPELHIVGLGIRLDEKFCKRMTELEISRHQRNEKMAKKLTSIGLPLTLEEVARKAGGEIITRAHFANILLEKGYIQTRAEAFSRYLSPGLPGYVPRSFLSPKDCISIIQDAGGIAILAHPALYHLAEDQLDSILEALTPRGLAGIECYYSTHTPTQRKSIQRLAKRHGLLASGGSDFHGENKPNIQLGRGLGNLEIPYGVWEDMKLWIGQQKKQG